MPDETIPTPEEVSAIEAIIAASTARQAASGTTSIDSVLTKVLALPVGARIERTEQGFEVFEGNLHGAGKSLARAFDSLGAVYETQAGKTVLVAANGDVLPPE